MTGVVDIVVPVYGGVEETRRCLESVLANPQRTPHEVVVVDDATPEPEIARHLRALAERGRITLLRNERNRGFVHSVNRGMALHGDRDVLLLNSDTEVANDWLDRLRAAACRDGDVATVTPLSNNATICSYPFEGWSGGVPGGLGLAGLDRLAARANPGLAVEIPTGVGFCMYVRRQCLDRLGLFDEERFGRGYGEENDFCRRAVKAGWRNLLAGDVYVAHQGAVSFSTERAERIDAATRALLEIHPEYLAEVYRFIAADPAAPLRSRLDAARASLGTEEAAHVSREHAAFEEMMRARAAPMPRREAARSGSIGLRAMARVALQMATPRGGRAARARLASLWRSEGLGGVVRRLRRG